MADWNEEEKQYTQNTLAYYWFQSRKAKGIAHWYRASDLRFHQNLSLAVTFLKKAEQMIEAEQNMQQEAETAARKQLTEEYTRLRKRFKSDELAARKNLQEKEQPKDAGQRQSSGAYGSGAGAGQRQSSVRPMKIEEKNHADALGFKNATSLDQLSFQKVVKAYRALSLKWHPDKNNAPEAEEMFKKISTAKAFFEALHNAKRIKD
jgi:hypothetical protein